MPLRKGSSLHLVACVGLLLPLAALGAEEADYQVSAPSKGYDLDSLRAMDLDQLMQIEITTTKSGQTAEEAPAVVEVVTREEIGQYGYRTVGEALRQIPGFAIVDDHLNTNVGVRGFYAEPGSGSEILKVMINGQPTSFRSLQANTFGQELIPIDAVERIEIIRGPASTLYGANAFLGVVNIITRDPSRWDAGKHFNKATVEGFVAGANQRQTGNGLASFTSAAAGEHWSYMLSANFQAANRSGLYLPGLDDIIKDELHERDTINNPTPKRSPSPGLEPRIRRGYLANPISQGDMERVGSAYGTVTYKINNESRLMVDGHYQHFDRYGEFQDYSVLTHKNRVAYNNLYGRLRYEYQPQGAGCSVLASLAIASGSPYSSERIVDNRSPNNFKTRDFGYTAYDALFNSNCQLGQNHILSSGVDFTADHENLLQLTEHNPATGLTNVGRDYGEKNFDNLGVFLQWQWQWLPRLWMTLGARADYNNQVACDGDQWDCIGSRSDRTFSAAQTGKTAVVQTARGGVQMTERAALVYSLPVGGLYAKAMYGSSFKPPSPYELYHDPLSTAATSFGDPTLKPQTADTFELLLGSKPNNNLHITGDVYFTKASDVVLPTLDRTLVQNRNADISTSGLELSLAYRGTSSPLSGYLNGNFLLSSAVKPQQLPTESNGLWNANPLNGTFKAGIYPNLIVNFGGNLAIPALHINLGVDMHYIGQRRASLVNSQMFNAVDPSASYTLAPYLLTNVTISSMAVKLLGDNDTFFSLRFSGVPGGYVEPGYGGIDIPGTAPSVHLKIAQSF